ncbi:hypothetical protein RintRC_6180 [Richelia intracellularis]|nr:hypothetical protein RintRC_6180 [Richelia intracellularis]
MEEIFGDNQLNSNWYQTPKFQLGANLLVRRRVELRQVLEEVEG